MILFSYKKSIKLRKIWKFCTCYGRDQRIYTWEEFLSSLPHFVFFKYQCGCHSCLTLYLLNPITNQLNHIIFKTGLGISTSKIHQMIIVCTQFMCNTKDKLVGMIQFYHNYNSMKPVYSKSVCSLFHFMYKIQKHLWNLYFQKLKCWLNLFYLMPNVSLCLKKKRVCNF